MGSAEAHPFSLPTLSGKVYLSSDSTKLDFGGEEFDKLVQRLKGCLIHGIARHGSSLTCK